MLSDGTIRQLVQDRRIGIWPEPGDAAYQPASVDLNLGGHFLRQHRRMEIDAKPGDVLTLLPGECVLAHTAQEIAVPDDLVARVEGKSTWGRRFLMVHATAGFIDPGFRGQITLELHNLSPEAIVLTVGDPIAQISFEYLDAPAQRPYGSPGLGSHYQGQTGATAAPDPVDDLLAESGQT